MDQILARLDALERRSDRDFETIMAAMGQQRDRTREGLSRVEDQIKQVGNTVAEVRHIMVDDFRLVMEGIGQQKSTTGEIIREFRAAFEELDRRLREVERRLPPAA